MVRFDQAVHHLREFLALDAQLSGSTGASEREDHGASAVLIICGHDREGTVFALLDVIDLFARAYIEIGAV